MKIKFILLFLLSANLYAQVITSVAPLKPGNKWIYRSTFFSQTSISQIEVLDSISTINGIPFYVILTTENSQTTSYATLLDNGLFARYDEIISDSLYTYFKLYPTVNDQWVQIWYDSTQLQNTIIDSIQINIFGKNVIIYAVDRVSETTPVGSREYWTKEFGMISAQYEQASDFLLGCVIDGVLYGDTTTVGIEEIKQLDNKYILFQNYPNPFNPITKISYYIPTRSFVTLKVYDTLGREIATVMKSNQEIGYHSISFNASELPSGVYFYKIKAGSYIEIKKMILMK